MNGIYFKKEFYKHFWLSCCFYHFVSLQPPCKMRLSSYPSEFSLCCVQAVFFFTFIIFELMAATLGYRTPSFNFIGLY